MNTGQPSSFSLMEMGTPQKRNSEVMTPVTADLQANKRAKSESDDEYTGIRPAERMYQLTDTLDSSPGASSTAGTTDALSASLGGLRVKDPQVVPVQSPGCVDKPGAARQPPGFTYVQEHALRAQRLARQNIVAWGDLPQIEQQDQIYQREAFELCQAMTHSPESLPSLWGVIRDHRSRRHVKHVTVFGTLKEGPLTAQYGLQGTSRALYTTERPPASFLTRGVSVALWEVGGLGLLAGVLYVENEEATEHTRVGLESPKFVAVMCDCL